MADNDIFRTHVPRAFQQTSRDVIRHGSVDRGVVRAIRAIDSVSVNWTRADVELVQRIYGVTLLPCDSIEERNMRRDEINEIVDQRSPGLVWSICRFARETMPTESPHFESFFELAMGRFIRDQIETGRIVAEAAMEYNRPIAAIVHDINSFERDLVANPEYQVKAREIARRPGTGQIRRIRPKPALEALLATPLTDLAS